MNIPCGKCGGSGKLRRYGSRLLHLCSACKGAGWKAESVVDSYHVGQVEFHTPEESLRNDPGDELFDGPLSISPSL